MVLSLVGCDSSYIPKDAPFILDFTKSHGFNKLISPRDLMTDVEYIKLGAPQEFYLSDAKKIIEFNEKLFVLDKNKKVVIVYDLGGNYIGQLGKKGRGPEEYINVYDFDVSLERNTVLLWSSGDNAILEFSPDFAFRRRIKFDLFASQLAILESGNVAFYRYFDNTGFNISIFSLTGKQINQRMPFPENGHYVPMDYTGFVVGDFYTYPLSSKIYKIREDINIDPLVFDVKFDGSWEEGQIFDHNKYLNSKNANILSKFTIGEGGKEFLVYYRYNDPDYKGYCLGVKLSGGQVFGHLDLKHGWKSKSDIFSKLFFSDPYNIPTYSKTTGYYYITSVNEAMFLFHNGEDEFHAIDKKSTLNEIKHIDYDLYSILMEHKDNDNPILMKFKLRNDYHYE